MPLPDAITTTAAAFYGVAVATVATAKSKDLKKEVEQSREPEAPSLNPIAPQGAKVATEVLPANWSDASPAIQADFRKAASFLKSYLRGSAVHNADREEVATVLAGQCKGTVLSTAKVNYRYLVDVFCCVQQSL